MTSKYISTVVGFFVIALATACTATLTPLAPDLTQPSGELPDSGAQASSAMCHRSEQADALCAQFGTAQRYAYTCSDADHPETALGCGGIVNGSNCCSVDRADAIPTDGGAPSLDAQTQTADSATDAATAPAFTLDQIVGHFVSGTDSSAPDYRTLTVNVATDGDYVSFEYGNGSDQGTVTLTSSSPATADFYMQTGSCGGANCTVPLASPEHYPCTVAVSGVTPKRTVTLTCASLLGAVYTED